MKAGVLACAAVVVWATSLEAGRSPVASRFESLWTAYQTDGHGAVERSIRTVGDYQQIRGDFFKASAGWRRDWQPIHARFFLDLIVQATVQRWLGTFSASESAEELIKRGREFVAARPDKPGQNPALDHFEVLWHRTVLAALQGNLAVTTAERYLAEIDKRVSVDSPPPGVDRLVDRRLALTAALVKEEWITPDTIARSLRESSSSVFITTTAAGIHDAVDRTLKHLDAAIGVPDTVAEALVRKGFLLFRLRRFGEALAALDSRPAPADDAVLAYWRALFRGRVLEELQRPDEAAMAFEDAARRYPEAQSPRVSLASIFQQMGRREDALAQRKVLGSLRRDAADPWWIYWLGDRRFVPGLLAAIREPRS